MKLNDRVAIVTGAAQGIGRAIAEKLHGEGATVAVADVDREGAERTAESLERGDAIEVDVSSEDSVRELVDRVLSEHGKIDVLVNNAAIVPFVPWDEVDIEHWRRIIDTNLTGVYLCSRAVYPPMRDAGYGRIVNIASNTVLAGTPNMAAYVAAKGGVWGFTRALATELGPAGITVNAVCPGYVLTDMGAADRRAEDVASWSALSPLGRLATVEDVAALVSFLASSDGAYLTGQALYLSGGMVTA